MVEPKSYTPRKILFVLASLNAGGAERVTVNLLKGLDRKRFSPVLAVLKNEGELAGEVPKDVRIIPLNTRRARYAFFKLRLNFRKTHPDIVVSNAGYVNVIASLAAFSIRNRKFPMVLRHTYNISVFMANKRFRSLYKLLYSHIYRRVEAVVAQTSKMAKDMRTYFKLPASRVHVIHNPVHVELRDTYSSEPGLLVSAGRLSHEKGYDISIHAMRQVVKKNPAAKLVILGKGRLERNLREKIANMGMEKHITLAGFSADPRSHFRKAHAFVITSRYESLPNTMLEALAEGTPVVATKASGGTTDIVVDGVNGFLCEDENANDIAEKITRMIGENGKFDRKRIAETTFKHYGMKNIVAKYEKLFESTLGEFVKSQRAG